MHGTQHFLIIYVKWIIEMQKNLNFFNSIIKLALFKVLVYKAPMWIRVKTRIYVFLNLLEINFKFISQIFFCIKNVFFWGIACWCSSKDKHTEGGIKGQFSTNLPPSPFPISWDMPTQDTSKIAISMWKRCLRTNQKF